MKGEILVVTTEEGPGRRVVRTLGLVLGEWEVPEDTEFVAQTLERMKEEAARRGANAVVGVRLTSATVMAGESEILAYGTAVVLEAVAKVPGTLATDTPHPWWGGEPRCKTEFCNGL